MLKNITLRLFPTKEIPNYAARLLVSNSKGNCMQFPIKKDDYLQWKRVFDKFEKEKK